jgi:GTPase SAR1 family protein
MLRIGFFFFFNFKKGIVLLASYEEKAKKIQSILDKIIKVLSANSVEGYAIILVGCSTDPESANLSKISSAIRSFQAMAHQRGIRFLDDDDPSVDVTLEEIAFAVVRDASASAMELRAMRTVRFLDGTMGGSAALQSKQAERAGTYDRSNQGLLIFPSQLLRKHNDEKQSVTAIDLSNNVIDSLPTSIGLFPNLRVLQLSANEITSLPAELCKELQRLEVLDLSKNRLTSLPSAISDLLSLNSLILGDNDLARLPIELGCLTGLQKLDLSNNRLDEKSFSQDFNWKRLSALHTLDLRENLFESLPPLYLLKKLKTLRLEDNPLTTIPNSLVASAKKNPKDLMAYLEDLYSGGEAPWNQVKLLILGKEAVGKTSLLRSFLPKLRIETMTNGDPVSTNGVFITQWKPPNSEIVFSAWDFGGQEVFYPTHQFFLTEKSIYVVVFRFGDESSLKSVAYWLRTIETLVGFATARVVIVGTHADLVDSTIIQAIIQQMKERILSRLRSKVEGIFPVSCTRASSGDSSPSSSSGLPELIDKLKAIAQSMPHLQNNKVPLTWLSLHRILRAKSESSSMPLTWAEWYDRLVF